MNSVLMSAKFYFLLVFSGKFYFLLVFSGFYKCDVLASLQYTDNKGDAHEI